MFFAELNTLIFKYFLVLVTAPIWLPFMRALLKELNDALAFEGGLFGRTPTRTELKAIERDPNRAPSPLVSLDFDPDDSRKARRGSAAPAPARARPASGGKRGAPAPAPGGFGKPRSARGFARKDQRRS